MKKYLLIGLLAIVGLSVGGSYLSAALKVANAPAEIIKKTVDADNILHNYEWFYDFNAQYEARLAQIAQHNLLLGYADNSKEERQRLIIEVTGMQQSCRDLATQYNANSKKLNRTLFKSNDLPYELNVNQCNKGE